jgi:hypothetical protein
MRKQLLTSIIITLVLSAALQAQSFTGTYKLIGAKVFYTDIARVAESADDTSANYYVEAHWPNINSSMFSTPLAGYAPGDTVAILETPDILLLPIGLAGAGIDLTLGLDMEQGTMLIPGIEGSTATYPTIDEVSCSTFATVAPVTDNATISYSTSSNSYNSDEGTFTWGFGMSQSDVFDWFDAPADWEDPTNDVTNYGVLTGYFNSDESGFEGMDLIWYAEDGQDSDSGIDSDGILNRNLGITTAPGDTVTVATLNAVYGTSFNVGSYPILGGTGQDLDGDGEPDGVVDTDWGYYFDPVGLDGEMMNGDEPFMYTGYYFTYNGLAALSAILTAAGDDADGDGIPDNLMALIVGYMGAGYPQDAATLMALADVIEGAFVAWAALFGVDATDATAAAAAVVAYAQTTYAALVAQGDPDALMNTAMATTTVMGGVITGLGIDIDDSDHDYDQVTGNGRLVFQIGNSCVPVFEARDVFVSFATVEEAGVISEDILPEKFAVYDNYPNPFNPTTQISFDLTENSVTEVSVWNLLGQKITTLYTGDLNAGHHTVKFDGKDSNGSILPSGVYIYRVAAGNNVSTKKMMLLK